jgi:hypothetical protein
MWCWGRETKYEGERRDLRSQWDSDMRGEVLLIFWYVQGSIYIVWNFKMKSWQSINFTACAKDRGLAWKSNLQNYHIRLITPVQLSHDLCDISKSPGQSWAEVVSWRGLTILIYQHAGVLGNCKTSAVSRGAQSGFAMLTRRQPKVKIIGNDQKSSQMSRNDQSWSLKVGIGCVTPVTLCKSGKSSAVKCSQLNAQKWEFSQVSWRSVNCFLTFGVICVGNLL